MCACNKTAEKFIVVKENGTTQTVKSEQEARTIVRIEGGSYSKAK